MTGENNGNLNVLIVDDQPVARDIVRAILRNAGFCNFFVADSAAAAEEVIEKTNINLIICDWNMPGTTGLQFLQSARTNPRYKTTPFLMLTAESARENVEAAVRFGVTDYLVKPFTAESLLAKVIEALGSH